MINDIDQESNYSHSWNSFPRTLAQLLSIITLVLIVSSIFVMQEYSIGLNAFGFSDLSKLNNEVIKIRGHVQGDQCPSGYTVRQWGPSYWVCAGSSTYKCPEGFHFTQNYCIGYQDEQPSGQCPAGYPRSDRTRSI